MSGDGKGGTDASADGGVTIVTQTRVRPEDEKAFAQWQDGTSRTIAGFPGFLHQTIMPPSPPAQVDWVILQRFAASTRQRRGCDPRSGRSASPACGRC